MNKYTEKIAAELKIKYGQAEAVISLLEEEATVPFIARYRKERTGGLDETLIRHIELLNRRFAELEKRKITVLETIASQGKLTDELKARIDSTFDPAGLEDIYLPYRPKRRTRATIARELGLEPLAHKLMKQEKGDVEKWAADFITEGVENTEKTLEGARDIMAEWISEDAEARGKIRNLFASSAVISTSVVKGKEQEGCKFSDYFSYSGPLGRCPSHRVLAILRGTAEGYLKLSVEPDSETARNILEGHFAAASTEASKQVREAARDGYQRLMRPSLENEFIKLAKEKADTDAIGVFSRNLRQLLLASPLGQKRIMALDPGFRTGCKLVCLNEQGDLLHSEAIYPHPPKNDREGSAAAVKALVKKFRVEAIAIGNGTAGRETEDFIRDLDFGMEIAVYAVSESGASIYSASPLAREEFPDQDVTVRGAVSIGRRLMDPLAELVKIDPKSIGVGQYQHDVDQARLKESLDFVLESCVNSVGVNLNTASRQLLASVSGLGPRLAQNIVEYRASHGAFSSRKELKRVPRLGEKAFEQCAGFLRIPGAENPLDNSAVHPESYGTVALMAGDLGCDIIDLMKDGELRKRIDLKKYVTESTGLPTLEDIKKELEKPGRDPRAALEDFRFAEGISSIEDLSEGMVLPGIVTNITNFGAFVDIGVHQDGLVHVSQMADRFVSNPADVVSLHQQVRVKVVSVDMERKRIQLSMKDL